MISPLWFDQALHVPAHRTFAQVRDEQLFPCSECYSNSLSFIPKGYIRFFLRISLETIIGVQGILSIYANGDRPEILVIKSSAAFSISGHKNLHPDFEDPDFRN